MNRVYLTLLAMVFVVLFQSIASADDHPLWDLLREKGVITQEEQSRLETAEENSKKEQEEQQVKSLLGRLPIAVGYGNKGFTFKTQDGRFGLAIQNRLQLRYAYPFDSDPRSVADLDREQSSFMVRRARFKVGGHAFWPWMTWYMQYDWTQPVLRDFYLNLGKFEWAQLRIGRGKVLYNDERVVSSGQQQFVNRSIVNDVFTVDRQQGVQLFGRLFPGTWHDFTYYAGVFTGRGVGFRDNDDKNMMYFGRLQWNFLGQELPWSQSDLAMSERPIGDVSFAAATNISQCTAFETDRDSCRALRGFTSPSHARAGQYRVDQMMAEFRFRWHGVSLTHEFHWKQIVDTTLHVYDPGRKTNLTGSYTALGFFPHYFISAIPKELELAGRYAFVDPNLSKHNDIQQEMAGVANWFFHGHANKLSLEVARLSVADPLRAEDRAEERIRLQWDISF